MKLLRISLLAIKEKLASTKSIDHLAESANFNDNTYNTHCNGSIRNRLTVRTCPY
jgi:hypothetical protein